MRLKGFKYTDSYRTYRTLGPSKCAQLRLDSAALGRSNSRLVLQDVTAANNDEEALAVDLIPRRLSPPTPVRPTQFRWLMRTDMLVRLQLLASSAQPGPIHSFTTYKEAQLDREYSTRSRALHIAEVAGGPNCDESWLGTWNNPSHVAFMYQF
ncbi:hypothetical protein PspLS_10872 [Pyricularia sp. CBS 133598]|nr:hypothetical protein PspLS_10872 [Pyricularia sp. CBS 133598]